jgi:hypothetical protein
MDRRAEFVTHEPLEPEVPTDGVARLALVAEDGPIVDRQYEHEGSA